MAEMVFGSKPKTTYKTQEELTAKFEVDGYIEFCDGDCIVTLEKYIEHFID